MPAIPPLASRQLPAQTSTASLPATTTNKQPTIPGHSGTIKLGESSEIANEGSQRWDSEIWKFMMNLAVAEPMRVLAGDEEDRPESPTGMTDFSEMFYKLIEGNGPGSSPAIGVAEVEAEAVPAPFGDALHDFTLFSSPTTMKKHPETLDPISLNPVTPSPDSRVCGTNPSLDPVADLYEPITFRRWKEIESELFGNVFDLYQELGFKFTSFLLFT